MKKLLCARFASEFVAAALGYAFGINPAHKYCIAKRRDMATLERTLREH